MRRILLLAKRDYIAAVANKGFLIGLILTPIFFGGSFATLALINRPDIKPRRVIVLDHSGRTAETLIAVADKRYSENMFEKATGRQIQPRYVFDSVVPERNIEAQRLELSDRIRKGDLFMFVEIGANALEPPSDDEQARVTFYASSGGLAALQGNLGGAVNEAVRQVRLARLGVDPARLPGVLSDVPIERMNLVERDPQTGHVALAHKVNPVESFAIPFALFFLLMMVVMMGSMPLLGAVAEDKMQRVFEMMLSSASPFEIMAGKVLAALGLSLTSSVLYVAGGIFALQSMALIGLAPLHLLPWFFAYLIADVLMLAAIGAGLGAATSTPQEAQHLAIFLILPIVLPSVLLPAILQQPNGLVATALSLFPPFTPLLMMLRQAMPGGVPGWQPWVGLVGVIGCTFAITWGAARIFRLGLLMQGKPPRLGELLRLAWRG